MMFCQTNTQDDNGDGGRLSNGPETTAETQAETRTRCATAGENGKCEECCAVDGCGWTGHICRPREDLLEKEFENGCETCERGDVPPTPPTDSPTPGLKARENSEAHLGIVSFKCTLWTIALLMLQLTL